MYCQGENLDLAITKDEVVVLIGEGVCAVKTLTRNHLYCEPPPQQPAPVSNERKREGFDSLPEFTVSSYLKSVDMRVVITSVNHIIFYFPGPDGQPKLLVG